MPPSRMGLLLTTRDPFHAKLLAARLGSDGILVELRGSVDGPYPGMGPTYVYVAEDDLEVARALLAADEAALDDSDSGRAASPLAARPWIAATALVLLAATVIARFL